MEKIRVLTIDDSALMREVLATLLSKDSDVEVVGAVPAPSIAAEQLWC